MEQQFNQLGDGDRIQFGMHKGKMLGDVPDSYLRWLWDNKDEPQKHPNPHMPAILAYIEERLDVIDANIKKQQEEMEFRRERRADKQSKRKERRPWWER